MSETGEKPLKTITGKIRGLKDRVLARFKHEPNSIIGLVYFLKEDQISYLRSQLVSNIDQDTQVRQQTKDLALEISAKFNPPARNNWVLTTQYQRTIGGVSRGDFHSFRQLWQKGVLPEQNDNDHKDYACGQFFPQGHLIIIPESSIINRLDQDVIDRIRGKGYDDPIEAIRKFWSERTIIHELLHACASKKLFTAQAGKWMEASIDYYTSEFMADKYGFDLALTSERERVKLWEKIVKQYGENKAQSLFFDDNLDFSMLTSATAKQKQ